MHCHKHNKNNTCWSKKVSSLQWPSIGRASVNANEFALLQSCKSINSRQPNASNITLHTCRYIDDFFRYTYFSFVFLLLSFGLPTHIFLYFFTSLHAHLTSLHCIDVLLHILLDVYIFPGQLHRVRTFAHLW